MIAAAVVVLLVLVWVLATFRRAKDKVSVVGSGLFFIGALLFFLTRPTIALTTLGIGVAVLAIRIPQLPARDEDDRVSYAFCAEETDPVPALPERFARD